MKTKGKFICTYIFQVAMFLKRVYKYISPRLSSADVLTTTPPAAFLQIYICKITVPIYNKRFPHLLRKKAVFLQIHICKNTVPIFILHRPGLFT